MEDALKLYTGLVNLLSLTADTQTGDQTTTGTNCSRSTVDFSVLGLSLLLLMNKHGYPVQPLNNGHPIC